MPTGGACCTRIKRCQRARAPQMTRCHRARAAPRALTRPHLPACVGRPRIHEPARCGPAPPDLRACRPVHGMESAPVHAHGRGRWGRCCCARGKHRKSKSLAAKKITGSIHANGGLPGSTRQCRDFKMLSQPVTLLINPAGTASGGQR